jgi:hypothetical protein
MLSFLPFLKVYTEPVHLAYAMVPASIAVAAAIEKLWNLTAFDAWPVKIGRYGTAGILALALGDHALTLYGSYRVVTACNEGSVSVAHWFKQNTPAGSPVIGNAYHVYDVRFFSEGHIEPYLSLGPESDPRAIPTPQRLEAFLSEHLDRRDVYLLDIDYEFPVEKAALHSHQFVQNDDVSKQDLGRIHVTSVQYPFLDPLRSLFPTAFVSFLGAPDLENDFYHGPALDGRFLYRQLFADYHVYKVTSKRVRDDWYPQGGAAMARANYHGYNVLQLNSRYFAIPHRAREFNLRKILRGRCPGSFVGDDLQKILRQIDRSTQPQVIQTAGGPQTIK